MKIQKHTMDDERKEAPSGDIDGLDAVQTALDFILPRPPLPPVFSRSASNLEPVEEQSGQQISPNDNILVASPSIPSLLPPTPPKHPERISFDVDAINCPQTQNVPTLSNPEICNDTTLNGEKFSEAEIIFLKACAQKNPSVLGALLLIFEVVGVVWLVLNAWGLFPPYLCGLIILSAVKCISVPTSYELARAIKAANPFRIAILCLLPIYGATTIIKMRHKIKLMLRSVKQETREMH